ncbi:MAG: winged helix-turn-helix transcriptional regulator [Candidatus Liptonbacteria bacterium]|nr:winged helix-turn-helix transcriptional regulator [Candidatus Liptonbacteria bacterium]
MREMEKPLKALANRRRLAILKHLKHHGEASVGDIAREVRISLKATSKHLGILSGCDIVEREQRSAQAYYWLARSQSVPVERIIALL